MALHQNYLFEKLKDSNNILIAGAGGGFDIYSGLPLYLNLKKQGKTVYLANLSFVNMEDSTAKEVFPNCSIVTSKDEKKVMKYYFPEKYLCEYLATIGIETPIYCFDRVGAKPLKEAYQFLINQFSIDTVILADGGTDSLMFGNEEELGTPVEDIASMKAVFELEITKKYLVCLGFGVDDYHGVSHYNFLENVADLSKNEGYLGVIQLLKQMDEVQQFLDAVEFANQGMNAYPSIVVNSIASSLLGFYGDYHKTFRTYGNKLWINPIMSMYWCFDLEKVMEFNQYHHLIGETIEAEEIRAILSKYRSGLKKIRPNRKIPI